VIFVPEISVVKDSEADMYLHEIMLKQTIFTAVPQGPDFDNDIGIPSYIVSRTERGELIVYTLELIVN